LDILHRNYFPYYIPRGFTNLTKWDYKKYPDTIGITVTSIDSREPEFAWRKLINKIVKSSWDSWNCEFHGIAFSRSNLLLRFRIWISFQPCLPIPFCFFDSSFEKIHFQSMICSAKSKSEHWNGWGFYFEASLTKFKIFLRRAHKKETFLVTKFPHKIMM